MTYPPMPGQPLPARAQPKGPAPKDVVLAVRLMYLRAAISLVGLIVVFASRTQFEDALRRSQADLDSHDLHDLVNVVRVIAIVVAIVFIVLYVGLAFLVGKGKNWARIVTWVFAGLGVLGALIAFGQDQPTLNKVLSVISGIIDAIVIVLLARGPANDYFRKPPPHYGPPPGYPPPGYPPPGYPPPDYPPTR